MKPNNQAFFNKIAFEFDKHVKQSIPLFYSVQHNIVSNISKYYPASSILDICGGTGELGRLLMYMDWDGEYTCLDGSPEMEKVFNSLTKGYKNLDFELKGFGTGWQEKDCFIHPMKETLSTDQTRDKYDICVESLGFQFFTPNREEEVSTMARLAPKLNIFFEKFKSGHFSNRELKKNSWYKSKFFSEKEIDYKQEAVLDKMNDNLYDQSNFEKLFTSNNLVKFAQIGNFAGYVYSKNETLKWDIDSNLLINIYN